MQKTSEVVKTFFLEFTEHQFRPKKNLFEKTLKNKIVYYLKEGHVRQYVLSEEGKELTVHIFNPGSFFPLIENTDNPEKFNYEAIDSVTAYAASKEVVLKHLKNNPEICFDLCTRLLTGISGLAYRLEVSTFGNSRQKVISTLIYLAKHFGEEHKGRVFFEVKFTHADIANFAGLSRETVSLEIERLVRENIISFENHHICILNKDKLKSKKP